MMMASPGAVSRFLNNHRCINITHQHKHKVVNTPNQALTFAPRPILRFLLHTESSRAAGLVVSASNTSEASASSNTTTSADAQLIPNLIEFLKEDLQHLFDDQGIDVSKYDPQVQFEDPITRYSSLQGYLLNIQFLRRVFDPTFILHDIKQTGPYEITTRWTMAMTPTFTRFLGPIQNLWSPELTFTGTSIMSVNPETGRFNKHSDTWDAISNQEYFSVEAFTHMLSQMGNITRVPALATPPYTVLKKYAAFEVRKYDPFTVAEAPLDGARGDVKGAMVAPASAGFRAFNALAGYIFGGNDRQQKMAMTTPVFSDTKGKMQFYLGGKDGVSMNVSALPRPKTEEVRVKEESGGVFAVIAFSGLATEGDSKQQERKLRSELTAKGLVADGTDWVLARYNDPGVAPPFRRNEVLIPLKEFTLW